MIDQNTDRTKTESRAMRAPGGIPRVVALEPGWWKCLDWMVERHGERLDDVVAFCERFVADYPDEAFATALRMYIHCFMRDYKAAFHRLANENYAVEDRV